MEHTTFSVDLAKSVFEVTVSHHPGQVAKTHRLSRTVEAHRETRSDAPQEGDRQAVPSACPRCTWLDPASGNARASRGRLPAHRHERAHAMWRLVLQMARGGDWVTAKAAAGP